MSEIVKVEVEVTATDILGILDLGAKMERSKRKAREVDGPFLRGGEMVFIVYTEDSL